MFPTVTSTSITQVNTTCTNDILWTLIFQKVGHCDLVTMRYNAPPMMYYHDAASLLTISYIPLPG